MSGQAAFGALVSKGGEKMCLGFRESEGFERLWAKGYRLQVAGGHLAFKELVMEGTLNDSSPSP